MEAAGVGGNQGVGSDDGFDLGEQGLFDIELFDNCFADPVGFGDPVLVFLDAAKADGVGGFRDIEVGGAAGLGSFERGLDGRLVSVEERDLEAEVC